MLDRFGDDAHWTIAKGVMEEGLEPPEQAARRR
jgi:hypothetical protein